jgi:hypothetical protein
VATTPLEKQALCDKQSGEEREGEVWIRADTLYIGDKVKAEKSGIIRTKYQIEFSEGSYKSACRYGHKKMKQNLS